jgi:outer membrane protein TolC
MFERSSCHPSRIRTSAWALLGALWCAVLPAAVRAETAPPPPAPAVAPEMPKVSLEQAIRRSFERNLTYVLARQEITRAEALVKEARAGSFPTITGNAIYTRLDADRTLQGNIISAVNQLSANITLTVPLVVPQKWAQWSHAGTNVDVARASADDVHRQIGIAVARAYLAVISEKRVIDVNERALANAKAHYDYAHTRLAGGVGNRVDDVRAEQEVMSDQAQIESSFAAIARAREALGILVGEDGPLDVVDTIVLAEGPALDVALSEVATRRRDVALSQARWKAAEQVRKDSYTDYLPFLLGTFAPFYQDPRTVTQPPTGWQAQLILTLPLYDGGLRYGLAEERAVLSAEARAEYDTLLRQARSDVRVAFEEVKRAVASLEAATRAARLAEEALELANIAYRAGATTNLEVIDAERRARDAETQAVIAEDTARQARLDLLAASGRFP